MTIESMTIADATVPQVLALAAAAASLLFGHSADHQPLRATRVGEGPVKVLVVGSIHGNETAGRAVISRLRRATPPAGVELWLVDTVNPDGVRRGTRQNARGVDLNRNFPSEWSRVAQPGDLEYAGPRPLSEPESRYAVALIRRLRPEITIWFHQPQAVVRAWGHSEATARRFAALAGVPYSTIAWPSGSASNWQNHAFPGTASFVVELPRGPVRGAKAVRYVSAIRKIAREGFIP
jgi:protein MpaA